MPFTFNPFTSKLDAVKKIVVSTGTGITVDQNGQLGLDTTDNQLLAYDGSTLHVVGRAIKQFTVTIEDNGAWANRTTPIWQAGDVPITIVEVRHTVIGSSTPTLAFNLEERAYGSLNSAGTDVFSSDQTADGGGEIETSFSNAGIAADAHLVFDTDAAPEGGSVDAITITVHYTEDRT